MSVFYIRTHDLSGYIIRSLTRLNYNIIGFEVPSFLSSEKNVYLLDLLTWYTPSWYTKAIDLYQWSFQPTSTSSLPIQKILVQSLEMYQDDIRKVITNVCLGTPPSHSFLEEHWGLLLSKMWHPSQYLNFLKNSKTSLKVLYENSQPTSVIDKFIGRMEYSSPTSPMLSPTFTSKKEELSQLVTSWIETVQAGGTPVIHLNTLPCSLPMTTTQPLSVSALIVLTPKNESFLTLPEHIAGTSLHISLVDPDISLLNLYQQETLLKYLHTYDCLNNKCYDKLRHVLSQSVCMVRGVSSPAVVDLPPPPIKP